MESLKTRVQRFLARRNQEILSDPKLTEIPEAEIAYGNPLPSNKVIIAKDVKSKEVYRQVSAGT